MTKTLFVVSANLPNGRGLEEYDGVAVTGSVLNVYDGGEAVERQLDLARAVYASRTAFLMRRISVTWEPR